MRTCARLLLASLVSLATIAGVTTSASPGHAAVWSPSADRSSSFDPARDLDEFEARILIRVNKVRERRGLPKVRMFQSCVDSYAEGWSRKLSRSGNLVHRNLRPMLGKCDLSWVGENLVSGEGLLPGDAIYAWMHSPAHRQILLKRRATWAGIGVRHADGRTYAVLNFGDRA